MNCINLATALHRAAKLVVTGTSGMTVAQLLKHPTFVQLRTTIQTFIEQQRAAMIENGIIVPTTGEVAPVGVQTKARQQKQLQAHKPFFEVQCLSIVCWSCATLRYRESGLMPCIADVVLPQLDELKPYELSNMIWAYAKLSMGRSSLFEAVSSRMARRTRGSFGLQCLSMIVWSFATAKYRDPVLFTDIASEITATASLTKPQEVANTVWAYAKTRCPDVALFGSLADTVIKDEMLWHFKPQELANTLWAFATIGYHHSGLFSKAAVVTMKARYQLSPQNIANILWAYAKLEAEQRSVLFPALLGVSVGMMPKHKPKEISAIAWAAAKENYPASWRFLGATAKMFTQRLHEFPPRALASLVEAFAAHDGGSPEFAHALARESLGRLHQFEGDGSDPLINNEADLEVLARMLGDLVPDLDDDEDGMQPGIWDGSSSDPAAAGPCEAGETGSAAAAGAAVAAWQASSARGGPPAPGLVAAAAAAASAPQPR
eukprot:TRINITY_DN12164_c0_g1_i2.p2 TRINITY_DN12164_c0_g1~~TRINITY_DN12164_c0_g1_i2.p2  ORF type:complete len:490 (-),score=130.11 TRINITY_DN12164_c0_g1_i2:90-1559(-)